MRFLDRVGGLRRLLVAALVLLAACTEDAPPTVLVETTVPRPVERTTGWDGETIRLAVLADVSGVGAALDRKRIAGVETFWAGVNAAGGVDGRFAVELLILDHHGDPARAAQLLEEVADEVLALAFVSETVLDALLPQVAELGLVAVPAIATASWETAGLLTFGLPIEAGLISSVDVLQDASWCVVVDSSDTGRRLVATANALGPEAGVFGLYDVVNPDLVALLDDAACSHVYVEVRLHLTQIAVAAVPPGRTIVVRSELGHGAARPDGTRVLLVDDGTEWRRDAAPGMARLLDDLAAHTPDAPPSPALRNGYASQIQLLALIEAGFAEGDLRRDFLLEEAADLPLVDMLGLSDDVDRSVDPPERPRQLRLFTPSDEGGGLGWGFVLSHRMAGLEPQLSTLAAAG